MSLDSYTTKPLIKSIGAIGSLFGIVTSVVAIATDAVKDPAVAAIVPPTILPWLLAGTSLVSLIGRITATKQIGGVFSSK